MLRKTGLGLWVCVLSVALLSLTCEKAKKNIVIGLQAPVTGQWAYEGQMAKQSCEITAALINKRGGILGGRTVEVAVEDDAGEPKAGALAATKMVGRKEIAAVVSTYGSSVCEPSAAIYEKNKKVNIGYGVTAVRLTEQGRRYFFRTCGRDDAQGAFFAQYVPKKFNAKRIAIMHDNTAYGKGLAENTRDVLAPMVDRKEVSVVYFDAITPGEKDFKVPLTKLRETKPEVWFYTGYYTEAAQLAIQAKDVGIVCPFVGGNAAINEEFVKIAGIAVAKGCYMLNEPMPADLKTPEAREFLAAYREKYGEMPSSPWPIYAADAVNVIAYAIDKSGSTDSDVLAAFLRDRARDVPGITGAISFNGRGDRVGVPYMLYVVDAGGKFTAAN